MMIKDEDSRGGKSQRVKMSSVQFTELYIVLVMWSHYISKVYTQLTRKLSEIKVIFNLKSRRQKMKSSK